MSRTVNNGRNKTRYILDLIKQAWGVRRETGITWKLLLIYSVHKSSRFIVPAGAFVETGSQEWQPGVFGTFFLTVSCVHVPLVWCVGVLLAFHSICSCPARLSFNDGRIPSVPANVECAVINQSINHSSI